jgi:hypothetical protein
MKCQEIRECMPDLAAGFASASPEIEKHLSGCEECAAKLKEFHQTMALLDEWRVPEPSPYFDVRLGARLREETAMRPSPGWWQWLRGPALAVSLSLAMVAGVGLYRSHFSPARSKVEAANIQPGTAVGDLQTLDKDPELADFDVLDDLQVQSSVQANP